MRNRRQEMEHLECEMERIRSQIVEANCLFLCVCVVLVICLPVSRSPLTFGLVFGGGGIAVLTILQIRKARCKKQLQMLQEEQDMALERELEKLKS